MNDIERAKLAREFESVDDKALEQALGGIERLQAVLEHALGAIGFPQSYVDAAVVDLSLDWMLEADRPSWVQRITELEAQVVEQERELVRLRCGDRV